MIVRRGSRRARPGSWPQTVRISLLLLAPLVPRGTWAVGPVPGWQESVKPDSARPAPAPGWKAWLAAATGAAAGAAVVLRLGPAIAGH